MPLCSIDRSLCFFAIRVVAFTFIITMYSTTTMTVTTDVGPTQHGAPKNYALAEGRSSERKRERETAEGGLASCQGKEDGWGVGGRPWRRKKYRGILAQNPRT